MAVIRIYVPIVPYRSNMVEETADFLTSHFGGATVYHDCRGVWQDSDGLKVVDTISVVESATRERLTYEQRLAITDFCLYLRRELKQDAIAYTISEGELYLV